MITTLRPLTEEDIPLLLLWLNDPEIRRFIDRPLPLTKELEREFLERLKKDSKTDIVFMIEVGGKPVGIIGIHRINWFDGTAVTGTVISPGNQGKGYGTDAKMALLNYAFDTLRLRKLLSTVKAFNERSLAYSKACGYEVEAKLREQHFVDGKYWDSIILAVYRDKWFPKWTEHCAKRR